MSRECPRVSVIIGFENARPFLGDAIASVRGQSFGAWELILVDDGSHDGSDEIARAAVFLASDRASFVTGQILAADGGKSAG